MNSETFTAAIDILVNDGQLAGLVKGEDGQWNLDNRIPGYGVSMCISAAIAVALEENPDWDGPTLASWLTSPSPELEGLSPIARVKADGNMCFDTMRRAAAS